MQVTSYGVGPGAAMFRNGQETPVMQSGKVLGLFGPKPLAFADSPLAHASAVVTVTGLRVG